MTVKSLFQFTNWVHHLIKTQQHEIKKKSSKKNTHDLIFFFTCLAIYTPGLFIINFYFRFSFFFLFVFNKNGNKIEKKNLICVQPVIQY